METISYNQVLELYAELAAANGQAPVTALGTDGLNTFNRWFNRWTRRGWEWYFWPDLKLTEKRQFRAEWTAQAYDVGAEVWHAATEAYYAANDDTLDTDVPGVSAKWDLITDLDAYVAYGQAGKTPLGTVRAVYRTDPRAGNPASQRRLPFVLDERGVMLTGSSVPGTVWVEFRRRCPVWRGRDWAADTVYGPGIVVYFADADTELVQADPDFDGDFFEALETTTAGQSPLSHSSKWRRLSIPTFLADFAAHGVFQSLLRGDGQSERALAEDSPAWTWLYDEMDKIEGQSGQVRRASFAR